MRTNAARNFVTVHFRHLHIEQNKVWGCAEKLTIAHFAIARCNDLMPLDFDDFGREYRQRVKLSYAFSSVR